MQPVNQWQPQAYDYLLQKNYHSASQIYEQLIVEDPELIRNYFYLGLLQLLQGKEVEAQFTWMSGVSNQDSIQDIDECSKELVNILSVEAKRQKEQNDYATAWLIYRHIHEIDNFNLDNLLELVHISLEVEHIEADITLIQGLINMLYKLESNHSNFPENFNLLKNILSRLLKQPTYYDYLVNFIEAYLPLIQTHHNLTIATLINAALRLGHFEHRLDLAIQILEICFKHSPKNVQVLSHLCGLYHNEGNYTKELETAQLCFEISDNYKYWFNFLILKALLNSGANWQEALNTFERQKNLLSALISGNPHNLPQAIINQLYTCNYFFPYITDDPKNHRTLQNQITRLCQANLKINPSEKISKFRQQRSFNQPKLKVGYLSHCMTSHSVGWLARWLIQYHDRQKFEIYGYFSIYRQHPDELQTWYEQQMDHVYRAGVDGSGEFDVIAQKIEADQIDILIDLDSITLDLNCAVMALKPAPVQVTWLGSDASGIPAIDYFIADPYVLPEQAQDYYTEKIWRLPQTYIAVDGFEVGVPTLRREYLDIPTDAVVYLSAQRGYKRHPETMRLQMQIIKSVPNCYFLIKGLGDQESIKKLFIDMAISEGVNPDCLRFLEITETEAIHRANLGIADIVLDTYPYNGATTTLETLWMGIPIVTRVGEQFAARNSYTMMINAGITEGLAWTDAEYVEWGVRLGTDAALRHDIATRLKASRQTSPLWNAEKFAREMEKAYMQMWDNFWKQA